MADERDESLRRAGLQACWVAVIGAFAGALLASGGIALALGNQAGEIPDFMVLGGALSILVAFTSTCFSAYQGIRCWNRTGRFPVWLAIDVALLAGAVAFGSFLLML